jgi:hypothetical protein
MSDFHDPELRQQLGRLSGPYPGENEAFATWQRRVGQARRRRAMMFTTGAAMTAIIAAVAVAALQGPHGHSLKSGDRTESTLVTTTTHVTTTEKPDTTATTVAETEASDDGLGDDAAPAISDPAVDNRPPATEAPTSASQIPATTTHKSSSGTSSSQPQTTGTTQPKSPSPRKTETSVGGTVTVKLDGNRLEIVDIEAAEGFDAHKNDHYRSRIDVTFTSHNHTSYITFTTSDGKIYSSTHESDTTVPGDNFGGGWGGGGGGGGGGD